MAIYLKKFETAAEYSAAESGLILPNVSLVTENNTLHYNPLQPTPPTPSHEYVDLGLVSGTKWATMNVGASSVTDYGNYYQYGKGSAQYAATSGDSDYTGTENPLAESVDTATQEWGSDWHMPTQAQLNELIANTTYEWTTINGVDGGKFTAQNGNYVFFPADGYWDNGGQYSLRSFGYYWSSTPNSSDKAYKLHFGFGDIRVVDLKRKIGCLVRPVMDA